MFCADCNIDKADDQFPIWNGQPQYRRCKACQTAYNQAARARRAQRNATAPKATSPRQVPPPIGPAVSAALGVPQSRAAIAPQMTFHASKTLIDIFTAVVKGTAGGAQADTLMFLGPSGCGKTTSARYLAEKIGLPFTHVDASAMTDPESWFGTREVVAVDGVSVTTYRPSLFVEALQRPGVLLLDEINRVRDEHRNIILPITDGTYSVTNPLTGETVHRHPECYIIMSGNRGLRFTGTYAVDPALMTRAYVLEFSYLPEGEEIEVLLERFPTVPRATASTLVRLATETRSRAASDPDFIGVSTRELLQATKLISNGVDADVAVAVAILNVASDEGGEDSTRSAIKKLWIGVRPLMYGGEATVAPAAN